MRVPVAVSSAARLLVHERALAGGGTERTWLELADGKLFLRCEGRAPASVELHLLDAVMKRYGKPLADDIVDSGPALELEGGRTLSLLRHRARYDVIAKDFLVYRTVDQEPVAELAASVTAALAYLVRLPSGD